MRSKTRGREVMKIQFYDDRAKIQIPKEKLKALGWKERLEDGEDIELDVSQTPERDGIIAREI
jgi:hypothetical protein